MKSENFMLPK